MVNKTSWIKDKAHDWVNYLPPARPATSELAIIEKYVADKVRKTPSRAIRVAVLGSTVELRSLGHKYEAEVTVIEFSKHHYDVLSRQYMLYKGKENLLIADWRKIKTKERFDFVFGDNVLNMLNTEGRLMLLKNAAAMLKKDGMFITRDYVKIGKMPRNWKEIIELRSKKYASAHFFTATQHLAFTAYMDSATEFTDVDKLIKELKELKKKGKVKASEANFFLSRISKDRRGISVPTLRDLQKQMRKHFRIVKMDAGEEIFSKYLKIHVLQRK
jgi:hypothetical protein